MNKLLTLFVLLWTMTANAQQTIIVEGLITNTPKVEYQNSNLKIDKVIITDNETIVVIEAFLDKLHAVKFSSATVLVPKSNGMIDLDLTSVEELESKAGIPKSTRKSWDYKRVASARRRWINIEKSKLRQAGFLINSLGPCMLDTFYGADTKKAEKRHFHLHFPKLPEGVEEVNISELIENGKTWLGVKIKNPVKNYVNIE